MSEGLSRPARILLNNQWGRLCDGPSKQSRNAVAWIARKNGLSRLL